MLYYIGYYIGDLLPPFLTALLSMRITDCGMIAQICKLIKWHSALCVSLL